MATTNQFLTPTPHPITGTLTFYIRKPRSSSSSGSSTPDSNFGSSSPRLRRGPIYDNSLPSGQPSQLYANEGSYVGLHFGQGILEHVEIDVVAPGVITIRLLHPTTTARTPVARRTDLIYRREGYDRHPIYRRSIRKYVTSVDNKLHIGNYPERFRVEVYEGRQVLVSESGDLKTMWRDPEEKEPKLGWNMMGEGVPLWCEFVPRSRSGRRSV